jgi:hypothetical protein
MDINTSPRLPVSEPNRLIVRTAQNPGELVMEGCDPDGIRMTKYCKYTAPLLIVPNLSNNKLIDY